MKRTYSRNEGGSTMRPHFNLKQKREEEKLTQIMLVMTLDTKRVRLYTGLRVKPRYWDSLLNRCLPTGKTNLRERRELEIVNRQIELLERTVDETDAKLASRGELLTESALRRAVETVRKIANCRLHPLDYLRQLALDYGKQMNRRGRRGNESSTGTYLNALRRLERYNETRRVPITSFDDFNRGFFIDFTNYLYKHIYGKQLEKRYTQNTVVNTLKVVKNLLHRAYDNEVTTNDYFKRVQTSLPSDVCEPVYLCEKEIKRLARVETQNIAEREVRDAFVIACYTALRISDLQRLNDAEIRDGTIALYQTKTKDWVQIPILKEIAPLIAYYRRHGFPVIKKAKANPIIRQLAERCHINDVVTYREFRGGTMTVHTAPKYKLISFHTARRSCITNLYKRGYPVNYIMTLSGHRSIQAFQRYMRASSKEMMTNFLNLLRKENAIECK